MFQDDKGDLHIEEEDQCYTCQHSLKGVSCIFLQALYWNIAKLTDEHVVVGCEMYMPFTRHLRLVTKVDPDPTYEPPEPG